MVKQLPSGAPREGHLHADGSERPPPGWAHAAFARHVLQFTVAHLILILHSAG